MLDRTGPLDINRRQRRRLVAAPLPKRDPEERVLDFCEVKLSLDAATAMAEASRCLQCPYPQACIRGCPISNDIPRAMWHIERGEFVEAANVFRQTSNLPEICSRVCPQVVQCEGACVQEGYDEGVMIGMLERFVTDYQRATVGTPIPETAPLTGHHVAVVGAGPAGLTVADELAQRGYAVTVFEAWPKAGGATRYGIPSFKLPKDVIDDKVRVLEAMGVEFRFNTKIGDEGLTADDLLAQGFDAVFLGTGSAVSVPLKVPGADLEGIYQATPFLASANLPPEDLPAGLRDKPQIGRRVAVIGGGDTAMDCLRTSLRLGAEEVTCVYRRTEAQMPGNKLERKYTREEGAEFVWLAAPTEFIGDEHNHVRAMRCQRMKLGEPDASGRRRPVPIEGDEYIMEVDTVILSLGYWPDSLMGDTTAKLKTHDWGLITIDANGRSSRTQIFAGGDNSHGADLVVTAMLAGQKAASAIDAYLQSVKPKRARARRQRELSKPVAALA